MSDGFWAETREDWCSGGWGAECNIIDLSGWSGSANVLVAFESYSAIGNPLFIDEVGVTFWLATADGATEESGLAVFPNPTDGAFTIRLPENGNFSSLQLVSPLGTVVYKMMLTGKTGLVELHLTNKLSQGIWLLRIQGEGRPLSLKIVVY